MYQKKRRKYYYPKRNSMDYQMIVLIFLRNQILTGILIDQMHYLVVESIVLWIICYGEFSAYCIIDNKPDHSFEYQPDEF